MLKLVSGFFLGVCVTVIAALVLGHFDPRLAFDPDSFARFQEDVEIGYKIPDALGRDIDPNERIEPFLPGKDRGVVIVTRRGVKTLRLCCDGSEPKPAP